MINYKTLKVISVQDWNKLVQETYGRPYNFQQQEGCQDRGMRQFIVPELDQEADMADEISEREEDQEMGVKFQVWLIRDPKAPVNGKTQEYIVNSWWERTFYPDLQTVANDLHEKGLIEAGDYSIEIDW